MDQVESKSKLYENISIENDPLYNESLNAIKIIKEFIKSRKLIIYGGTAIDFALRIKGDKIYPDELLAIPDLDFYSPDSVKDAYDLCDILYTNGYKNVRAIVANYVRTMRVDIGQNHFLADISYVPPNIFKQLPYIEYEGMKCIAPIYQMIDMHNGFAFPYDNPPREVIFARWQKDTKRYNLLLKYYPISMVQNAQQLNKKTIKKSIRLHENIVKYPFIGFAAYNLLLKSLKDFTEQMGQLLNTKFEIPKNILWLNFEKTDKELIFELPQEDNNIKFMNYESEAIINDLKLNKNNMTYYYSNFNLIPARFVDHDGIEVWSMKDFLLSVNTIEVDESIFIISNIHFILKYMLLMHETYKMDKSNVTSNSSIFLDYYISLQNLIKFVEEIVKKYTETITKEKLYEFYNHSPFYPSIYAYGADNKSESYKIAIKRILYDLREDTKKINLPSNYYPEKTRTTGKKIEKFIYDNSEYFIKDGRKTNKILF